MRNGLLEEVAHPASVAEAAVAVGRLGGDERVEVAFHVGRQHVLALLCVHAEHRRKLLRRVVGELHVVVEARGESGIGVDEPLHFLRVARHDHHETVAVVLHALEERGNRLLAVGVVLPVHKRIRLVDEQDAAQRRVDHLAGLDRRLPRIAGHERAAVAFHEVPLLHHAERLVDLRHDARDGRLARAGVAREHHVIGDRRDLEPLRLALLRHAHELREPRHLLLDGLEAHEPVQLRQRLLHAHHVRGGGRQPHAGHRRPLDGHRVRHVGGRSALRAIPAVGLDRTEHGQQHRADENDRPDKPSAPPVQQVELLEQPPGAPRDKGKNGRVGQRVGDRILPHRAGEAGHQHNVKQAPDAKIPREARLLPLLTFLFHTSPPHRMRARPARIS